MFAWVNKGINTFLMKIESFVVLITKVFDIMNMNESI